METFLPATPSSRSLSGGAGRRTASATTGSPWCSSSSFAEHARKGGMAVSRLELAARRRARGGGCYRGETGETEVIVDQDRVRRARGGISRREFLRLGGAGLAVLGAAGCGGEGGSQGGTQLTLTFGPDQSGGLRTLVDRFNKENKGE